MDNFNKYLVVNKLEKDWGFYVTTIGKAVTQPRHAYPDNSGHPTDHLFSWNNGRILDGYYLVYITKGKGTFESSVTEAQEVTAGTCFFLFPEVWHRYKPDSESGWEEYWIGFKGSYPDDLMNKGFFNRDSPFIYTGINENLLMLFHKLIDTVDSAIIGYHQIVTGITLQILAMINSISTHQQFENDPAELLIRKIKFLLQESLEKPLIMEELVGNLPMSYSKFRKAFKHSTKKSPNQYLLDLRLDKAKELLQFTTLTVDEISYKTGFNSIAYFSNYFKKRNGISPRAYREVSIRHSKRS